MKEGFLNKTSHSERRIVTQNAVNVIPNAGLSLWTQDCHSEPVTVILNVVKNLQLL